MREISLTHTKIETPDGQIVLQPNREMSSSKIINFTVLGRRRIVYKVTASYDAPTDEVKQACMDAVLAFPAVLKEPTPTVYLSNYGASSIEYTIRCWTAADAYWDTYFKMYERLRDTFAKHNVEMSYDHLNIHVVPEKQNENSSRRYEHMNRRLAQPPQVHKKPKKPSLLFRTVLRAASAPDLLATHFHCEKIGMAQIKSDEPALS